MARVLVLGGGLAGLAAAAALSEAGHEITVLESRAYAGGRASSYPLGAGEEQEVIDNCQHILLRCCVNLLDFYGRLRVSDAIQFHRQFYFIEPGGRTSVLKAGVLPSPLHFLESFARLKFLSASDKIEVARGLLAIRSERNRRKDLDRITMLDWLREKGQSQRAIDRFWRQILVSAVNEELDRMAARHGFQVFWLGFLASRQSYEMGIPAVPLGDLYSAGRWHHLPNVSLVFRSPVTAIRLEGNRICSVESSGRQFVADHYVCALPFERLAAFLPELAIDFGQFEHSPITGIHLWFDRPVTDLPHATLLDRTIQWMFNKDRGVYLQLVVSASRSLTEMSRNEIIDLARKELAEFIPFTADANIVRAHVVKEVRATFSARPGLEHHRPGPASALGNLSLAGDWTDSGWPATMEGAVRSGYRAAEHASAALGIPRAFLLPDIA